MLARNTHAKYRKYRKNKKCNKIPDLERKEAKKGPEMSANIAKISKVTRIYLATTSCKKTSDILPNLEVKGTYKVLAFQTPPLPSQSWSQ